MKNLMGTHYLYTDEHTGKGPDDVASLIIHYLENFQVRKSKSIIFWADNCGGRIRTTPLFSYCII
jgi:hypothetical protein